MPITIADLEAVFRVNLDPLKAGIAEGLTRVKDLTAAIKQEGQEHARATEIRKAAADSEKQLATEADRMTASAQRATSVEEAQSLILKQMAGQADKASLSLRQFGTAASQAGRLLTVGLSAPLLAVGGFALKSEQDIAKAMNTIREETGATGARLAGLGDTFRQVAAQVPQSFGEVGKAVALVAQRTGLTGTALASLSKEFLTLSRITGTDVNPLVTQATKVFQQYGIAAGQQREALNQLNRAHQATGIGVDDLLSKMLRFAPAFKAVGLGASEAEALLGAFNKQGVVGDKALTALNITFSKWAKAGITDAHSALVNLIAAVQKAPSAFAALKAAQEAGMGGRGGLDFVNAVRSGGVEFQKFLDIILHGKDTIAKAGADTLTVANQFDQLKNKVALAMEPLGRFIAQQLKDLGKGLDDDTPKLQRFMDSFAHQGDDLKKTELSIVGILIALGPLTLAIGKAATGWAGLRTVFLAGLPIAALLAFTAFLAAFAFNFHGLRDDLERGWDVLWTTLGNRLKAFGEFVLQEFEVIATPWKGDIQGRSEAAWAEFGRRTGQAYADAQRDAVDRGNAAVAARVAQARIAIGSSGIGELRLKEAAGERIAGPFLPMTPLPAPHPAAAGKGLGGGHPDQSPNLKAETDAHRQLREALDAESKAREVLKLVGEGYSKQQAELIARYGPATAAIMKQTEAYDAAARKIEDARKIHEKALHMIAELQAKTKDLNAELAGTPVTHAAAAVVRLPGASAADEALIGKAQAQYDKAAASLKNFKKEQATAGASIDSVAKQLQTALAGDTATMATWGGETRKETTAEELFAKAVATGRDDLITQAQAHLANAAAIAQHNAAQKALLAQYDEQKKVVDALLATELKQQDVAVQLGGDGKQLTEVQKALNFAYESGDPFLIAWAEDLAKIARAQDIALKTQKETTLLTNQLTAGLTHAQEVIDSYGAGVTLTVKAQTDLNAALKLGDPAVIALAQQYLAAAQAADALVAAHKESVKEQSQFQQALKKTADFFKGEFTKGFEGFFKTGLKNFFPQLLADLDSLLQQMAAKILAANLTSLLFGNLTGGAGAGAGGATGGGGGGLLGSLLGGLTGLLGGGGGGSPEDLSNAAFGLPGPDLGSITGIPGMAAGGFMPAGQAAWTGERGPELFIPQQPGNLIPNHALTQAGGGRGGGGTVNHYNMTVVSPDAAGFKKSQHQILADLHRTAEAKRMRDGG